MVDELPDEGRSALRYLTRFTKEFTSFDGWRLALTRCGISFTRYFSVLQYGGERAAFEEARRMRDALLGDLEHCAADDRDRIEKVFDSFREVKAVFPDGFRAAIMRTLPSKGESASSQVRTGRPEMINVRVPSESKKWIFAAASRVGVDASTFIKAAVYLLLERVELLPPDKCNAFALHALMQELHSQEIPSFAMFSTGSCFDSHPSSPQSDS